MSERQTSLFETLTGGIAAAVGPAPPEPVPESAPYVRGSETSKAAAESVVPVLGRHEGMVLDLIRAAGELGATDDEIEVATGLRHQTASARRRGLVLKGRVRDSGDTRNTRSGCKAVVWVTI